MPEPLIVTAELFCNAPIHSAAVSAAFGRLYVGSRSEDERRLNLLVATLAGGRIVGRERRYRDSPLPLPPSTSSTIEAVVVDATLRKLFLVASLRAASPPTEERLLTSYDLDPATGEPRGTPRAFRLPGFTFAYSLARHPILPVMYVGGTVWPSDGGPLCGGVAVFDLDPVTGWPSGDAQVYLDDAVNRSRDSSSKRSLAVHPAGTRLYVGADYRIQVAVLDANGRPPANTAAAAIYVSALGPVNISYSNNRLWYVSRTSADRTGTLQHLDLDAYGDPLPPLTSPSPLVVRLALKQAVLGLRIAGGRLTESRTHEGRIRVRPDSFPRRVLL